VHNAEPEPEGFDSAGGSRVLLSGQQMVQQLAAATPAATGGSSAGQDGSASAAGDSVGNTLDEMDEAESSMDEDMPYASSASSEAQQDTKRQQQHAVTSTSFAAECKAQLQKAGLLGALVAAAYPDRIAQLKPGSGGKASYSLSNGEQTAVWTTPGEVILLAVLASSNPSPISTLLLAASSYSLLCLCGC
jgi:hypothetical protein